MGTMKTSQPWMLLKISGKDEVYVARYSHMHPNGVVFADSITVTALLSLCNFFIFLTVQ